ncbi:MAG: EamA family transporter [Synechococcaceae cyanobacterium]
MPLAIPAAPSPALATAAALTAAFCWTLASLLWRRLPSSLPAPHLNLLKNLLALALQLPLALAQLPSLAGALSGPSAGDMVRRLVLLAASGVLGIALGDSFHFAALRRLGTRRCLTLEAGGPALTTLAGVVLLGEVPRAGQWLGVGLISLAVVLVARQRPPSQGPPASDLQAEANGDSAANLALEGPPAPRPDGQWERLGLGFAVVALVCGCAGALLARGALLGGPFNPLQAATLRLGAASLVMAPLLGGLPGPRRWRGLASRHWPLVVTATLLGTSIGIVLQQTALAGLPGGLAVALLATAPLMGVVIAPLEGDSPGWPGVLAALAGLVGVSLVVGLPLPGLE